MSKLLPSPQEATCGFPQTGLVISGVCCSEWAHATTPSDPGGRSSSCPSTWPQPVTVPTLSSLNTFEPTWPPIQNNVRTPATLIQWQWQWQSRLLLPTNKRRETGLSAGSITFPRRLLTYQSPRVNSERLPLPSTGSYYMLCNADICRSSGHGNKAPHLL